MARQPKSLKGSLLLDGGNLHGSLFRRSVVLICQHDPEGAFGLILNKSTGARLGEVLPGNLPDSLKSQPLFSGGPVQPQSLSYLHSDLQLLKPNVMKNLNVGHSLEDLVEIAETNSLTQRLLVFAGYAGWDAGQLDDEMRREAWLTHPASLDLIFSPAPETLWNRVVSKKGWRYRLMAEGPEDLSSN
ncbi:MAG: YqgE/AlgH family protein [Verrucomicrobiales bacterium]|nr:YqgE/AlgH family protein [Verrucomicrobiales bacterium]